jgi:site-specific DNA-cytosine methylase
MNRTLAALALTFALAAPAIASAQTVMTPTGQTATEQRQRDQETRFQQAIAAGRIAPREAAVLTQQMQRIQHYQERAYADGVLTLREQARLQRFQDRYEQMLARAISR